MLMLLLSSTYQPTAEASLWKGIAIIGGGALAGGMLADYAFNQDQIKQSDKQRNTLLGCLAGALVGGISWVTLLSELSDSEELIKAEELYHRVSTMCNQTEQYYSHALSYRNNPVRLKEEIYQNLFSKRHPCTTYKRYLKNNIYEHEQYYKQLAKEGYQLLTRKNKLLHNDDINGEEKRVLMQKYEAWYNNIEQLKRSEQQLIGTLKNLKSTIKNLDHYRNEKVSRECDRVKQEVRYLRRDHLRMELEIQELRNRNKYDY